MNLKRFLWRSTAVGRSIDIAKSIKETGDITKGYKKVLKEYFTEDAPVTSQIYEIGKYDGAKEGYMTASSEYEKKLLEQADLFLSKKKLYKDDRDAYEQLLDEYKSEIERLSMLVEKNENERAFLQELLIRERNLKRLAG